jgi:hypothetical protein
MAMPKLDLPTDHNSQGTVSPDDSTKVQK